MPTFKTRAFFLAGLLIASACGSPDTAAAPPEPDAPATQALAPVTTPAPEPAPAQAEPDAPAEITPEFAALPVPFNTADYDRGRRTWRLCSSCHMLEPDAGHRVGPNLYGMFGRQVGTAEGFPYSDALLDADFVWTDENLYDWLANPRTFLPGNRMSFSGVRRPEDRIAVIAYIKSQTGFVAETSDP